MKRVLSSVVAAIGFASAAWGSAGTAYAWGVVVDADSWHAQEPARGFYRIPLSGTPSELPLIRTSGYVDCNAGSRFFYWKIFSGVVEKDN